MNTNHIDLAEFLNQQYLCESLTLKEIETLLDFTEVVTYRSGQIVVDIGEVGEALYFVVHGEAALVSDKDGNSIEVGRLREGEMIGEMSFFDRNPRSLRIIATKNNTRLLRLSRVMYQRLRIEHPYIAVNLLEHAIISLDHLFRRISSNVSLLKQYFIGNPLFAEKK